MNDVMFFLFSGIPEDELDELDEQGKMWLLNSHKLKQNHTALHLKYISLCPTNLLIINFANGLQTIYFNI